MEVDGDEFIIALGSFLAKNARRFSAPAGSSQTPSLLAPREPSIVSTATARSSATHRASSIARRAPSAIASLFSFAWAPGRRARRDSGTTTLSQALPPMPQVPAAFLPQGQQQQGQHHAPGSVSTTATGPVPTKFSLDLAHLAFLEARFRTSPAVRAYIGLPPLPAGTGSRSSTPPSPAVGAASAPATTTSSSSWMGGWMGGRDTRRNGSNADAKSASAAATAAAADQHLLHIFQFLENLRTLRVAPLAQRKIRGWNMPAEGTPIRPSCLVNTTHLELKGVPVTALDLADLHAQISVLAVHAALDALDQALYWPSWTSLATLNLAHNALKDLDAQVLARALNLTHLILHHNLLERVPPVHVLPHLAHLDLSYNQIAVVAAAGQQEDEDHGAAKTETDAVSRGPPAVLHETLQELNLAHNALEAAQDVQDQFPALVKLNIANNNLASIPPFHRLAQLGDLRVLGNPFADLPEYRIAVFRRLARVDLVMLDGSTITPDERQILGGNVDAAAVAVAVAAISVDRDLATPSPNHLDDDQPIAALPTRRSNASTSAARRRHRLSYLGAVPLNPEPLVIHHRASEPAMLHPASAATVSPRPPSRPASTISTASEPPAIPPRPRRTSDLDPVLAGENFRQRVENLKRQNSDWMRVLVKEELRGDRRSGTGSGSSSIPGLPPATATPDGKKTRHRKNSSLASSVTASGVTAPAADGSNEPDGSGRPPLPPRVPLAKTSKETTGSFYIPSTTDLSSVTSNAASSIPDALHAGGGIPSPAPPNPQPAPSGTSTATHRPATIASHPSSHGATGSNPTVPSMTTYPVRPFHVELATHTKPVPWSAAVKGTSKLHFERRVLAPTLHDLPHLSDLIRAEVCTARPTDLDAALPAPVRAQLTVKTARTAPATYMTVRLLRDPADDDADAYRGAADALRAALARQVRLNLHNAHYDTVCAKATCLLCKVAGYVPDPGMVVAPENATTTSSSPRVPPMQPVPMDVGTPDDSAIDTASAASSRWSGTSSASSPGPAAGSWIARGAAGVATPDVEVFDMRQGQFFAVAGTKRQPKCAKCGMIVAVSYGPLPPALAPAGGSAA
ncbi:hypothetical protein AMAG_05393 [Allomyces macrogynus ATCC 38327]|uniref:Uncharacterized protein n=1 Tax=Allomyces macrogynus (strain ATCC 38327) TaxID=578462 RepID=A0A0L0SBT7_ALLM3|nr:hypothetical protein AMAG_05393 [Allomyces macrogynus ATCC 38327]|eukprot:KNE59946.1 hypothetical protein AMAG_05393 [Allomyces macrogynus ATCC 38327]